MPLPGPLTPPDLDLRDFDWMPLQVVRLRDSGIVVVASAEAFRAAVLLWCAAWHQVPAASLPKDEKMLCSLAGFGRDLKSWRPLAAEALHGFIECSDGRLYHSVIAEKAIESGSKKKKQGSQTAAATEAARLARIKRDAERNGLRDGQINETGTDRNGNQERGPDRTGPEKTEPENKKEREPEPLSILDSRAEKDKPKPIDENYQPSDPAIEYAYSLGMKKADLTSELSKFCADGRAKRAFSFDLDASFKKRCDQWLDYKRKHEKPTASSVAPFEPVAGDWGKAVKAWLANESNWPRWAGNAPGSPVCPCPPDILLANGVDPDSGLRTSSLFFLETGTTEFAAHLQDRQTRKQRAPRIWTITVDGVEKTGAYFKRKVPEGYDEATGERIAPSDQESAA